MRIQQRSTGIPRIDRSISLDCALDLPAVLGANWPLQTADDSRRKRAIETKRISNRQDLLSHDQLVGISHWDNRQSFLRCLQQSDDREIRVGIAPNYFRRIILSTTKANRELLGSRDDVIVGENVALLVNN